MAPRTESFPGQRHPRSRARRVLLACAAASLALGGVALPGAALETLSPQSMQATEGDACPVLTSVKYPWLGCRANEYGGISLSLPSQPAPKACEWRLPDGTCAASTQEWNLVPMIPRAGGAD